MALVLGTNCGFVTVAPTADPLDFGITGDDSSGVTKDISPAGAIKITEIGCWCDTATTQANFEVGLYAADGAVVPGEAGTLLYVSRTNAKGTTAGWKRVTVDWDIEPNTAYWLGFQLDNTTPDTYIGRDLSGGMGMDNRIYGQTTLPNPFGGGALGDSDGLLGIYAVWEAGAGTNSFINIGDVLRPISNKWINIGDVWRRVTTEYINIGDAWRKIF